MQENANKYHRQTAAIRCGHRRSSEQEHSEPIFATSSFVFDNAQQASDRFSGDEAGNVYSRFTNPTVEGFEKRLAALEGGRYCVATASGMAAITGLVLALLKAGDHVVASTGLFGSTVNLFNKYFNRFGIDTSFVNLADVNEWKLAVRPNTRLFFLETPSNPLCEMGDINAIAEVAGNAGILLVVDNAFYTPALSTTINCHTLSSSADLTISLRALKKYG